LINDGVEDFKFGRYVLAYPMDVKAPLKGLWPGHVTYFKFEGRWAKAVAVKFVQW